MGCAAFLSGLLNFGGDLPKPLKQWVEAEGSAISPVVGALMAVIVLGFVASSIGLFFLKRWAAWLFLGINLLALIPDSAANVAAAWEAAMESLTRLVSGTIIGISFFSGLLQKHVKQPETVSPA